MNIVQRDRDEKLHALLEVWDQRVKEITAKLDRCDSAKAYEVMRCRYELAMILDTKRTA
jgi:hypothetical protein